MKILRISLRNLASLEKTQTVDFSKAPLVSTGLFAICGPTGSGKSTLLDGLCLALYDQTPRLKAVKGNVKVADGEDSVTQKDSRNLLRRGCGEGFAEVVFIGVDGVVYTARWSVRRARGLPDGALQGTEMGLFLGNTEIGGGGVTVAGGRKTEVLSEIEKKIGLSYEQFTRAVLLAQNDFATFLKADDHERAAILQALTGTEKFEAISKAVFFRKTSEDKRQEALEARLSGNLPLSAEKRLEVEGALQNAEGVYLGVSQQLLEGEAHGKWFDELTSYSEVLRKAEGDLGAAKQARDAAESRRKELSFTEIVLREGKPLRGAEQAQEFAVHSARQQFEKSRILQEQAIAEFAVAKEESVRAEGAFLSLEEEIQRVRPDLDRARELDSQLGVFETATARFSESLGGAKTALKLAKSRLQEVRNDLAATRISRDELRVERANYARFESFVGEASGWGERLKVGAETLLTRRECEEGLNQAREISEKKRALLAAEKLKGNALRVELDACLNAESLADTEVRKFDSDRIRAERQENLERSTGIQELLGLLQSYESLLERVEELRRNLESSKVRFSEQSAAMRSVVERELPLAQQRVAEAQETFEQAEAAIADETVRLREKLRGQQPCPVCGGLDHPYTADPPSTEGAVLRVLREKWGQAETRLREVLSRKAALEAGLRDTAEARVRVEGQLQVDLPRLEEQRSAWMAHREGVEITGDGAAGEQRISVLRGRQEQLQAQREALDKLDSARIRAEKLREQSRFRRELVQRQMVEWEKLTGQLEHEFLMARTRVETAEVGVQKARELELLQRAVLAPVFERFSVADFEKNPEGFRNRFSLRLEQLQVCQNRDQELGKALSAQEAAGAHLEETLVSAERAFLERLAEYEAAVGRQNVASGERKLLFHGRSIAEVEREFVERQRAVTVARDKSVTATSLAERKLAVMAESLQNAWANLERQNEVLEEKRSAMDRWLAELRERTGRECSRVELDLVCARDDAWIQAERRFLEEIEATVHARIGSHSAHQSKWEEHLKGRPTEVQEAEVREKVERLRADLAMAEAERSRCQAEVWRDDRRRIETQELWGELEQQRLRADRWIKLNDLVGSADGSKFRAIAQRKTLDILLGYANAQLEILSARYRLERIRESLNLIVVDRDMGDERRSVHSLSGGESFLVSLALALGLASLSSNRLPIESLFIDEGFGSLDPATLNTAMGALMQLENQGRKVGVISHVTEMSDAIPIQIRVVKGRSGASRLVVPGAAEPQVVFDPKESSGFSEEEIAGRILGILERERTKVSVNMLREEIGCSLTAFNAARTRLGVRVVAEGRSLRLSELTDAF